MMWLKEKKRRLVQVACAILYNLNLKGFAGGEIYKGSAKMLCVPGLNCYSCPGAVASCPLGSFQTALVSSKYKAPYYMLGMLILFGIVLGRTVCGYLCPFGLLQELLWLLPGKKVQKSRYTRALSWLKYVILAVFAVGIPLVFAMPGFCKYICPAGTLEGGLPLTAMNERLRRLTGGLFVWKVFLLAVILLSAVFVFRSFCRFLCPLGAFYSFFHKTACVVMRVDEEGCMGCQACISRCPMDVKHVGDRECIYCGKCARECPTGAISSFFPVSRKRY